MNVADYLHWDFHLDERTLLIKDFARKRDNSSDIIYSKYIVDALVWTLVQRVQLKRNAASRSNMLTLAMTPSSHVFSGSFTLGAVAVDWPDIALFRVNGLLKRYVHKRSESK